MEKHGTPESKGKCDICGEEGIVVPVDKDTMKLASKGQSSIKLICPGHTDEDNNE